MVQCSPIRFLHVSSSIVELHNLALLDKWFQVAIAKGKKALQSSDTMESHRILKLSQMQSYTMS